MRIHFICIFLRWCAVREYFSRLLFTRSFVSFVLFGGSTRTNNIQYVQRYPKKFSCGQRVIWFFFVCSLHNGKTKLYVTAWFRFGTDFIHMHILSLFPSHSPSVPHSPDDSFVSFFPVRNNLVFVSFGSHLMDCTITRYSDDESEHILFDFLCWLYL